MKECKSPSVHPRDSFYLRFKTNLAEDDSPRLSLYLANTPIRNQRILTDPVRLRSVTARETRTRRWKSKGVPEKEKDTGHSLS